jgi:hypothetical protein
MFVPSTRYQVPGSTLYSVCSSLVQVLSFLVLGRCMFVHSTRMVMSIPIIKAVYLVLGQCMFNPGPLSKYGLCLSQIPELCMFFPNTRVVYVLPLHQGGGDTPTIGALQWIKCSQTFFPCFR